MGWTQFLSPLRYVGVNFRHSYFFSPMATDSRLLAAEDLPVFSFILTQPTSFSLSTLFTIPLAKLPLLFAKTAFGSQPPRPLGDDFLKF